MELIDKSVLVAEIEKRIKKYATVDVGDSGELEALYGAKCHALMSILTFIDTLETKQNSWNNAKDIKAPSNKDILAWYRKNDGVLEGSPKVVWFCSDEESAKETDLAYWIECPDEEFDKTYWFEKQAANPQGKTALEAIHEEKVDNANKVEPKCKVGDWIVKHNIVYHIDKISGVYLTLSTLDGTALVYHKSVLDSEYTHLWTIVDAKDGDVLVTENFIFIFKNIDNGNGIHYYCHYEINKHEDDNQFDIAMPQSLMGRVGNSISHYFPATKEQRDLLFQKMKKMGWEWDAEAKKLNKKLEAFPILSNSSKTGKKWTEEDEELLQHCCGAVAAADYYTLEDKEEMGNLLKSLKQRNL